MKPDGRNIAARVRSIEDADGTQMESAPHPKQVLYVDLECSDTRCSLDRYDILRRKEED